jgi:hypothetical protein
LQPHAGKLLKQLAGVFPSTVTYGYDIANRQTSEDQLLTGQPTRHIDTPLDVDGNRASIALTGAYTRYYDYTQRQQLAQIRSSSTPGSGLWFGYTYDLNGNVTPMRALPANRFSSSMMGSTGV